MAKERKQSLFIVAFEGRDTADEVYQTLRDLRKQKEINIKTAAVIYRKDNGKLKLVHKRRVTTWGGAAIGSGLAVLLAGLGGGAGLIGAVIGGAIGGIGAKKRRQAKKFLDNKLGMDDSALAILIKDADWDAVAEAVEKYPGDELVVELTPEAEYQLASIALYEDVAEAVGEEVEFEEDVEEE